MVLDSFFLGKKMVLDRKTNFFLGQRWFVRKTNFSERKDGFGVKNHLFPRENQKPSFWCLAVSKDGFFCFFGFP